MSFHKQQKCFGLYTTVNPTFREDDAEKVEHTSEKNPGYAPAKARKKQQESWETSLSSIRGRTFREALIKNHSWRNENKRKKRVTKVVSGRSVKCNASFAVCDLSALGFKMLLLVCSPVWILDMSNIWEHHAKVRTTDIHNIVLYAKTWFHGRKPFWILRLFNISALPSLWQLHVTVALDRSWQLKSAFLAW